MDPKIESAAKSEIITPTPKLVTGKYSDTLEFHLPLGYQAKDLKVVRDSPSRTLTISGTNKLGDNNFQRFKELVHIGPIYAIDDITARFQNNVLSVTLPILAENIEDKEEKPTNQEQACTKTPDIDDKAAAAVDDDEKKAKSADEKEEEISESESEKAEREKTSSSNINNDGRENIDAHHHDQYSDSEENNKGITTNCCNAATTSKVDDDDDDDYKQLEAADKSRRPASTKSKLMKKMAMARQKITMHMHMLLPILFAFLGMCITKLLAWLFP